MSTTDCGSELKLAHRPGAASRFGLVVVRTKSAWRAIRNRLASNALYEMDDRQLDDIGICRHDVAKALERSGVLEDPSRLLSQAAHERAAHRFMRPSML